MIGWNVSFTIQEILPRYWSERTLFTNFEGPCLEDHYQYTHDPVTRSTTCVDDPHPYIKWLGVCIANMFKAHALGSAQLLDWQTSWWGIRSDTTLMFQSCITVRTQRLKLWQQQSLQQVFAWPRPRRILLPKKIRSRKKNWREERRSALLI